MRIQEVEEETMSKIIHWEISKKTVGEKKQWLFHR
jgi:hypothetical protein